MTRLVVIGLVLAFAARAEGRAAKKVAAKTAERAPRELAARVAGVGKVRFVTAKRAYLDRGALDGLKIGDSISLQRLGRNVGSCKLETVAERESTCVAANLRPGDVFRTKKPAAAKPAPEIPKLPPLVPDDTLDQAAAEIAETPLKKVDFTGTSTFGRENGAEASLGHAFWANTADFGGGYQQERVDLSLRGIPLGFAGYRAYAEMSAIRWVVRPPNVRFRPGSDTQFYLWEAEVTSRDQLGPHYVLSVGRIWPWHTPGLAMLDGVQLGWRSTGRGIEAGVYGGLYPDSADLSPNADQWAGGGYSSLTYTGTKDGIVRLARQQARVGVRNSLSAGLVFEAETVGQLWLGPVVDMGGGGRFAVASKGDTSPSLESAFGQIGVRPRHDVRGFVSFRYQGRAVAEEAPLPGEMYVLQGSYWGALDVAWDIRRWLGIAVLANADQDLLTSRYDVRGGGEIRLPRLFRDRGGVSVGYEQSTGWVEGNTAYAQLIVRPLEPVLVLGRLSFARERFDVRESGGTSNEVGAYTNVDARVAAWLHVRASLLARTPITIQGLPREGQPAGLVGGLHLAGVF